MNVRKRLILLLAGLLLLCGCGSETPAVPEEPEPVLPETAPAGAVSAPAIVMEGRELAEDYALPPFPGTVQDSPRYDMKRWAQGGVIQLLAEVPEADVAFYGLPWYEGSSGDTALIRWGDSLAEFDWIFCPGPSFTLPRMACLDVDGDWEDELIVVCQTGTGTGISICELHILEKNPDGTLTACTFPESLWQEEIPKLFRTGAIDGRAFAILGYELVELERFNVENLDLETASSGAIANFDVKGNSLSFRGAFCLSSKESGGPCYVAETSAWILYQDGVFILQDFHLYSYY